MPIFQRFVHGAQYTFLKPNLKNMHRRFRKINSTVEKTKKRLLSVLNVFEVVLEVNTQ